MQSIRNLVLINSEFTINDIAVKCHFNHQLCDGMIDRIRDLMRAGVIKLREKPIWYDVYEAFPPKRDPLHVKPHTRPCTKKQETVPEIFYREDEVRL